MVKINVGWPGRCLQWSSFSSVILNGNRCPIYVQKLDHYRWDQGFLSVLCTVCSHLCSTTSIDSCRWQAQRTFQDSVRENRFLFVFGVNRNLCSISIHVHIHFHLPACQCKIVAMSTHQEHKAVVNLCLLVIVYDYSLEVVLKVGVLSSLWEAPCCCIDLESGDMCPFLLQKWQIALRNQ